MVNKITYDHYPALLRFRKIKDGKRHKYYVSKSKKVEKVLGHKNTISINYEPGKYLPADDVVEFVQEQYKNAGIHQISRNSILKNIPYKGKSESLDVAVKEQKKQMKKERKERLKKLMSEEEKAEERDKRSKAAKKAAETRKANFNKLSPEEQKRRTNQRVEKWFNTREANKNKK